MGQCGACQSHSRRSKRQTKTTAGQDQNWINYIMPRIVSTWRVNTKTVKLEHIDKFLPDDVFVIMGMIEPKVLYNWLEKYGQPAYIVMDQAGDIKIDGLEIYSVPLRGLAFSFDKFEKINQATLLSTPDTKFCFNFFVNENLNVNKYTLIKLVEYFKFDCFDYVLNTDKKFCSIHSLLDQLPHVSDTELLKEFRHKILKPIALDTKHNKNYSPTEVPCIVNQWTDNLEPLFDQSAVSLISEPHGEQIASIFTEKTMFAIMGLTFPIFVGGYGNADYLKQVGLDTFDDIIDHSYQFLPTLPERCFYAFKNNLHILTDLELAKQLRQTYLNRLVKNRDLVYDQILTKHVYSVVDEWPESLKSTIKPFFEFIQKLQVGKSMRLYDYVD
jgi:hypothetical protein